MTSRAGLLALALVACSGPQGEVAVPVLATASGSAVAIGPDAPLPELPQWEWIGSGDPFAHRGAPEPPLKLPGGVGTCTLTHGTEDDTLGCKFPSLEWTRGMAREHHTRAALAATDRTIFVVRHHSFATGAVLSARKVTNGDHLWDHPLEGCGRVSHSEYYNAVQIRTVGAHAVVFGNEIACRYIELVHGDKGVTLKHSRLPPHR